ncbi:MAG: hypothetical protein QOF41_439 [Methylobacteriaceae bacterium]|nr:hypothetical protein [Methylobacteriaceae bacterium]
MWTKAKAAALIAGTILSTPAYAQYWYGGRYWVRQSDGGWIGYSGEFVLAVVGVLLVALYYLAKSLEGSSSCESAEDQAERYEEEARLTLAHKRKVDAQTELMASTIDAARMKAAYDELKQITLHDRGVRRLTHRR